MDEKTKHLFEELTKDREDSADILEKPSMRGVKRTVVEKYSDQAHFIYELLQNADDVEATEALFDLYKDKLIFKHNGKRHFSVTNPSTEDEDSKQGKLGDINSITSIANSNKTRSQIGKFGVGFKAVFQYTSSPMIFDPLFCFQIDRFIVPKLLDFDFEGRKSDETVFLFPFDTKEKTKIDSYNDISKKLHGLTYPLLFLNKLNDISIMIENKPIGKYSKKIERSYMFDKIKVDYICLTNQFKDKKEEQKLWLFTSLCSSQRKLYSISVGFFVNEKGKLTPIHNCAFCFFPTKEITNLNFIIQAPFLLTDSREGIKANEVHNKDMIVGLSKLAANSIMIFKKLEPIVKFRFIDDDILNIIPINENVFDEPSNANRISFKPFYAEILNVFQTQEIIPAIDGYVSKSNAILAAEKSLIQLFSNDQLASLCNSLKVKWVFITIDISKLPQNHYIWKITNYCLTENSFLKEQINNSNSYSQWSSSTKNAGWSSSTNGVWGSSKKAGWGSSTNAAWGSSKKAESNSFNYSGWSFLQNKDTTKKLSFAISSKFIEMQSFEWLHKLYKWIKDGKNRMELVRKIPILLDQNQNAVAAYDESDKIQLFLPFEGNTFYKTVNENLLKNPETSDFVNELGISRPLFKDEILNIIIPKYKDKNNVIDTIPDFKKFFEYFKECKENEKNDYISLIKDIDFLIAFSKGNNSVIRGAAPFLYFPSDELFEYFETKPQTLYINLDAYKNHVDQKDEKLFKKFLKKLGVSEKIRICQVEIDERIAIQYGITLPHYTRYLNLSEDHPDGFDELFASIKTNPKKSLTLWKLLLSLCKNRELQQLDKMKCKYFFYTHRMDNLVSTFKLKLISEKWILNSKDELVSAKEISSTELGKNYQINAPEFPMLINFLEIKEKRVNKNFTKEQQAAFDLFSDIKEFGLLDQVKTLIQKGKMKKSPNLQDRSIKMDENDADYDEDDPAKELLKIQKLLSKSSSKSQISRTSSNDNVDEDDFIRPNKTHYSRNRIFSEIFKNKAEFEKIQQLEELKTTAEQSTKYSFMWFKTLLQMELIENNNGNNKGISITFSKVELEEGTSRTLILKHPNRYIPLYMEELSNIPLTLHFDNTTKIISIEVINVQSYTIRAKFKSQSDIEDVDLNLVEEAEINATNPIFLFEELKKCFSFLKFDDDFNMRDNLSENIEFIFGPPGTGKTTYLTRKVIIPLMQEQKEEPKILVLTPTNKAADVVVKRIIECMKEDSSYKEWLVRFGTESEESIESASVHREKSFDIQKLNRNVTVTTIARFPYDYFNPDEKTKIYLKEMNWDYIIFDEASMIPLINVVYPLYKQTPKKFIVAGDPFQIQPITTVDFWKNENIYTFVNLNSFVNPKTQPHQYKVELLTTQFRSVPSVGNIYSKLTYGGILKHNRKEESKKLNIDEFIKLSSLNIIKFPVSKYESIYKPKKLQNKSSYQIYSALFVFEFVQFLSQKISMKSNEKFSIGIIAAYRAETDLIDKIFSTVKLNDNIKVQIGTIHGFQGDECDIVFAVFNPPPKISSSSEMFLNNKNIINVAISRTRDYLFVVMPDDRTENIKMLELVNEVEDLCKQDNFIEYDSHEIEKIMYNDDKYIENNSFTTSHQLVNVYCQPDKKYEIRCDETAIDIFIKNV